MPRVRSESFTKYGVGLDWEKEYEYAADVPKLQKWFHEHGYKRHAMWKIVGLGVNTARYFYAKGNFTIESAKKLAVATGMSLYDFIDIFLSDIYPVTEGDFNE